MIIRIHLSGMEARKVLDYERRSNAVEGARVAPALCTALDGTRLAIGHDLDMKWACKDQELAPDLEDRVLVCCHGKDLPYRFRRQHFTGTAHQFEVRWEHPELDCWTLVLKTINKAKEI